MKRLLTVVTGAILLIGLVLFDQLIRTFPLPTLTSPIMGQPVA